VPQLKSLFERFAADGFVVVGVHTPMKASLLPAFLEEHEIRYPVAVDTGGTAESYGVSGFPTYVLVDRSGVVRGVSDHPPRPEAIRELLAAGESR
jgi:peroxiredoxin